MDETKGPPPKQQDGKKKVEETKGGTEAKRIQDYMQIVEDFMRKLREKFTITPEISKLIISVYDAIDRYDFPEATKSLEAILRIVKETRAKFKDFDLDGVLPAFTKK